VQDLPEESLPLPEPWTEEQIQRRCLKALEAWILVTLQNPSNKQMEALCRFSETSLLPLETFLSRVRDLALHQSLFHGFRSGRSSGRGRVSLPASLGGGVGRSVVELALE